jgi:serine O-acetyltransferase
VKGHDRASGLLGDVARLFSDRGTVEGRPSVLKALERVATRPGPQAIALYRLSRRLWLRGLEFPAELLWRVNYFLTGADIHPGAEIRGGLRLTHTAGVVVGKGVRIGSNVTLLHGVTLGGSARGWFDGEFADGFPEIGDDTEIMAGAAVLGPIKVGRGCFIGANAVLARDLPDGEAYTPGRETKDLRERVEELTRRVQDLERELAGRDRAARGS